MPFFALCAHSVPILAELPWTTVCACRFKQSRSAASFAVSPGKRKKPAESASAGFWNSFDEDRVTCRCLESGLVRLVRRGTSALAKRGGEALRALSYACATLRLHQSIRFPVTVKWPAQEW
jgi:hypothetical protein